MEKTWKIDNWYGLYRERWGELLHPDAVSHPAKLAKSLAFKIVTHLIEEGWLKRGDTVLDPFNGVGTIGLPLAQEGIFYIGSELEPKFVDLTEKNFVVWRELVGQYLPWYAPPRVIQGDSRKLIETFGRVDSSISSPPYATASGHPSIGSVNKDAWGNDGTDIVARRGLTGAYGEMEGQLGVMPNGDFTASISSPPYAKTTVKLSDPEEKMQKINDARLARGDISGGVGRSGGLGKSLNAEGYGDDPLNLANISEGDFEQVISSPPYAGTRIDGHGDEGASNLRAPDGSYLRGAEGWELRKQMGGRYGNSEGNLANLPEENTEAEDYSNTFWGASKLIVQNVFALLKPGGHATWIVKDYVKNKQIVPFCDQWRQLCESVGFVTIHEHHAYLDDVIGVQIDPFTGEEIVRKKSRQSFFKNLHRKKYPKLEVAFEVIFCMEKPV